MSAIKIMNLLDSFQAASHMGADLDQNVQASGMDGTMWGPGLWKARC